MKIVNDSLIYLNAYQFIYVKNLNANHSYPHFHAYAERTVQEVVNLNCLLRSIVSCTVNEINFQS